jgi:peptidyl-prolyl cis-trans isomerase A (cyclophilin A)
MLNRHSLAALVLAALAVAGCARRSPLLTPDPKAEARQAPDSFTVRFETTRGPFTVQFTRDWAPRGADRVYYLVRSGYYDGVRFFRVLPNFVAQFGASGDPKVAKVWERRTIRDDPVKESNRRGTVTFATAGPNTRTTQLFVNLGANARLDRLGFAPLGRVVDGMTRVVDSLYTGYGEGAPRGKGPDQDRLAAEGNAYLARDFPKLDWIRKAEVVHESRRKR